MGIGMTIKQSGCKWGMLAAGVAGLIQLCSSAAIAQSLEPQSTASSPVALTMNDRYLWSVNMDSDSVSVMDTASNTIVETIPVGSEPNSLAISPDGSRVFVTNAAANTVTVLAVTEKNNGSLKVEYKKNASDNGQVVVGAEPRSVVVTPDSKWVFVANASQDTIVGLSASSADIKSVFDLRNSECNVGDRERHFQPRSMAISEDGKFLYVSRFLSYTTEFGVQRDDFGKEGVVCKLEINSDQSGNGELAFSGVIRMQSRFSGFMDANGEATYAFPNQLQRMVIHGDKLYLPNIGASPTGPQRFDVNTQSLVNIIADVGGAESDYDAINLHLGGRDPESGQQELYFANPWAMAFTKPYGQVGSAYVVSAGSDILVKLTVTETGDLRFTQDEDTTRYIDLNDPDNFATNGSRAGKNPIGIAISRDGATAYVLNYVSRNISIVDLNADQVVEVVATESLPEPGSLEERILVGAEMFYSSRGNFEKPEGAPGSNRNRLSEKGRQNCASCHSGGLTDGVIWQFATGPRKTLAVNGTFDPTNPQVHKIINASAIFDEVEDADFNTRLVSSAGYLEFALPCIETDPVAGVTESKIDPDHGLVLGDWNNFELAACVMNAFARPNGNRAQPFVRLPGSNVDVKAHDALIDWQRYAIRTPNAPMTAQQLQEHGIDAVGAPDEIELQAGAELFVEAGCSQCHNGGSWTTSRKDFVSPPEPEWVATESGAIGANPAQYLYQYLVDIGSFNLNVAGAGNQIAGYPEKGGVETDSAGRAALGYDHNNDGKGTGYNVASILGAFNLPPFYHNGACETLSCVLADEIHRSAGLPDGMADVLVSEESRRLLVRFLESIDEQTPILD
ncbi:MAG: YncE family protein [Ketobacter sp.]|nr:MAG: YncE family protein [Ketobacter sp.]